MAHAATALDGSKARAACSGSGWPSQARSHNTLANHQPVVNADKTEHKQQPDAQDREQDDDQRIHWL
jgi:hypothetical protein